jgi:hypothetical protein
MEDAWDVINYFSNPEAVRPEWLETLHGVIRAYPLQSAAAWSAEWARRASWLESQGSLVGDETLLQVCRAVAQHAEAVAKRREPSDSDLCHAVGFYASACFHRVFALGDLCAAIAAQTGLPLHMETIMNESSCVEDMLRRKRTWIGFERHIHPAIPPQYLSAAEIVERAAMDDVFRKSDEIARVMRKEAFGAALSACCSPRITDCLSFGLSLNVVQQVQPVVYTCTMYAAEKFMSLYREPADVTDILMRIKSDVRRRFGLSADFDALNSFFLFVFCVVLGQDHHREEYRSLKTLVR